MDAGAAKTTSLANNNTDKQRQGLPVARGQRGRLVGGEQREEVLAVVQRRGGLPGRQTARQPDVDGPEALETEGPASMGRRW